jgi:GNAT superfamily N-acetyltransferase
LVRRAAPARLIERQGNASWGAPGTRRMCAPALAREDRKSRKEYDATLVELPDYRLTCIFVDKACRKKGIAKAALQGALDMIAEAGGGVVEGYPHDLPEGKKMSSTFLDNLTRRAYEQAGFTYDRSKGKGNCVTTATIAPR